ncbi:MAG: SGNH/GDSL hydrolase family protein [Eubacteriales bacterium]
MLFKKSDRILFQGDSITDCGRARPIAYRNGLGGGYPAFVDAFFAQACPELELEVLNVGISGDTTRNLLKRWDEDVLAVKPDYLSIMIGVNDVWRRFNTDASKNDAVYIDEYIENMTVLLERTKPTVKNIILVTPFIVDLNKDDAFSSAVAPYAAFVREQCEKHGFILVDAQSNYDEKMKKGIKGADISGDRVHPSTLGHIMLTSAWLRACGFNFGTL